MRRKDPAIYEFTVFFTIPSTAKVQGDILQLRVSKISDVEVAAFEGPLAFFKSLDLKSDTHDVSKIRNLLAHSLNKFSDNLSQDLTKEGRDALEPNMLKPRDSLSTFGHIIMTGVRAVFAESGMWVITEDNPGGHTSFPAWLPMHIKGATTKYHYCM